MILDELVLHNFGVYRGRQVVSLAPPSTRKPVILFGGMNGEGKTTILDALVLAFYGKLARCSGRGGLAYEEFLRRSINRSIDPIEGAAVELQFRHMSEGNTRVYRIHRSWRANGAEVKEHFEVLLDGKFDPVISESWADHVEGFIPSRISNLFFFDGDKIESLADLENSSQLLGAAIQSLLGLDLVGKLISDLMVLERRKRSEAKTEPEKDEIEAAKKDLRRAETVHEDLIAERGKSQNELDRQEKCLREIEQHFREEGGELFEQREALESERAEAEARLREVDGKLRDIAAGAVPLLLVEDLLSGINEEAQLEDASRRAEELAAILKERDEQVVARAVALGFAKNSASALSQFLSDDRSRRCPKPSGEPYLNLDQQGRESLATLLSTTLRESASQTRELLLRVEELQTVLGELDRKLARTPDQDAILTILDRRAAAREAVERAGARVTALDGELGHVRYEVEQKRSRLMALLEKAAESELELDDSRRIVTYSQRVRDTLEKFRGAMVNRNLQRIERLVRESLQKLLRKQSLITDLKIGPIDFKIELYGPEGLPLSPERLSAGERQLLAVALLWGLGRASGRPLPAVIDTPLGRLDSSHRTHLVDRYFPCASHQVVLLSTDEEIDERYYEKLRPFIGREYHLEFDDTSGCTQIQQGYFW